jgi:hypothetical protein
MVAVTRKNAAASVLKYLAVALLSAVAAGPVLPDIKLPSDTPCVCLDSK